MFTPAKRGDVGSRQVKHLLLVSIPCKLLWDLQWVSSGQDTWTELPCAFGAHKECACSYLQILPKENSLCTLSLPYEVKQIMGNLNKASSYNPNSRHDLRLSCCNSLELLVK